MNIGNTEITLAITATIGASAAIVLWLTAVRALSSATAAKNAASRAAAVASRAIELATEANRLASDVAPVTRFSIAHLLSQEDAPQLIDFFNGLKPSDLIVSPEYIKTAILSAAPYCAARWGVELPAPEAIPSELQKIIVVDDYAERETKAKYLYNNIGTLKCYGMYNNIIPAINSFADPFDIEGKNRPRTNYAVICHPRSGSELLCAWLANRGLGSPREHLRVSATYAIAVAGLSFNQWLDAIEIYGQSNCTFGTKLLPQHLLPASRNNFFRTRSLLETLRQRGYKIFFLRRNLIDCIISFIIAHSTMRWHINNQEDEENWARDVAAGNINLEQFEYWTAMYLANDILFNELLKIHKVTYLDYETLNSNPVEVVKQIARTLGVRHTETRKVSIPLRMRDKADVYVTLRGSIIGLIKENRERLASIVLRHVTAESGLDVAGVRDVLGLNGESLASIIRGLLL